MKTVFLVHEGIIQHYRVPVYNYLSDYLREYGFALTVVSEGIQEGHLHQARFKFEESRLTFMALTRLFLRARPDAAVFWVSPHIFTFPFFFTLKLLRTKIIHWGHRRPMPPNVFLKTIICNLEHWMDDAIVLYSEQFRKYVFKRFHSKTFIANNTLNLTEYGPFALSKENVKRKYGIWTGKNIIYMGRIQRRRRLDHLLQAFGLLNIQDVGLILAGPDDEGLLKSIDGANIFKPGPVYGEESLNLLFAADVYCLPGSIGLSIVDALYCGLPVVTEEATHGPEIMYLKDGINGFMVPSGDIAQLTAKLQLLLRDDALRERFSQAARNEIMTSGHIDRMCEGFRNALWHVCK